MNLLRKFTVFIQLFFCVSLAKSYTGSEVPFISHVNGISKEGFATQIFDVLEDNNFDIWTSSSYGVFKFNRLDNIRIRFFDNKSDVLKLVKYDDEILFFHSNMDVTILKNGRYSTIEFKNDQKLSEFKYFGFFDVKFNSKSKSFITLPRSSNDINENLSVYELFLNNKTVNMTETNLDVHLKKNNYKLFIQKDSVFIKDLFSRKCYLRDKGKMSIVPWIADLNLLMNSFVCYSLPNEIKVKRLATGEYTLLNYFGELTGIIEDFEGNIWISTRANGMYFFEMNLLLNKLYDIGNLDYGSRIHVNWTVKDLFFSKKHGFFINSLSKKPIKQINEISSVTYYYKSDSIKIGYEGVVINHKAYSFKEKIMCYYFNGEALFIGRYSGLYKYNDTGFVKIFEKPVSALDYDESSKEFYFSSSNNLFILEGLTNFRLVKKCNDIINTFRVDNKGMILATRSGVYLLTPSGVFYQICTNNEIKYIYYGSTFIFLADEAAIFILEIHNLIDTRSILIVDFKDLKIKKNTISLSSRSFNFFCGIKSNYKDHGNISCILIKNGDTIINNTESPGWINISNLAHGKYSLILCGINNFGISVTRNIYKFDIQPYYYESLLFKVVFGFFALTIVFTIMIVFINFKKNRMLKRNLVLENENFQLQLLKSQLNPHFLFNSLNSLKGLIYSNNKNLGLEYLDKLAVFLRSILKLDKVFDHLLSNEIEVVKSFIEIENIRLENQIILIEKINDYNHKIPANILQPIIENAIKYGFNGISELNIIITTYKKDGIFIIEIFNDGLPFIEENINNSFSLSAIKRRIDIFNDGKILQCFEIKNITNNNVTGVGVLIKLTK